MPVHRALSIGIVLLSLGCGDDTAPLDGAVLSDASLLDGGPSGPCLSDDDVYREVFEPSCTSSACHDDNRPKAGLDLESLGITDRIVGQGSIHDECGDQLLVVPGQPPQSFMINKLLGTHGECGEPMPENDMVESAQLRCVAEWIEAMDNVP